jgi:epsilon-lactone hydrolase
MVESSTKSERGNDVMPSARSRAVNAATRVAMRIAYRRPLTNVADYRPRYARTDDRVRKPLPVGMKLEDVEVPVEGRWIRNSASPAPKTILYVHGGAFILRLPKTHTAFAATLAHDLGASAFLPWYRLAPEHPFPAAPEDCLAAYRHLLDVGTPPSDIVVMGDSAGGNLVLSLLHLIRRESLPMPGAVVALSPITDFAQISSSWRLNKWRDPMYVVQGAVAPQQHYLQGASPVDPVASPYFGDLSGFPPILVVVGGVEAMIDDSVSFVKKAVEAGVDAHVHIWKGMPHVFLLYELLPETAVARRTVVDWVNTTLLAGPTPAPSPSDVAYRTCVEVFDYAAFTGRIRRETNDVYFDS